MKLLYGLFAEPAGLTRCTGRVAAPMHRLKGERDEP